MAEEEQAQDPAPEPKRSHRGFKYTGKNGAHYSGIPARDLSADEVNHFFSGYDGALAEVARDDAIYAWDGPEGDD